jgi:hypothetical protein
MVNNRKNKRKAPYVSAATLSQFLDHIRYVSTPKKVDTGLLLDYGISKGNVFALTSALKFLGLIDNDGKPTPAFSSLQVMGDEFVSNLREVVNTAYADLFTRLDVSRDSREHIRNYFSRNFSPSQSNKSTILFLDLCKEAGIPVAASTEAATRDTSDKVTVSATSFRKRGEHRNVKESIAPTWQEEETPLSYDKLRNIYLKKLIDEISPPNTAGKDADAVRAEMELRKAELDRIEKLLDTTKDKEKE